MANYKKIKADCSTCGSEKNHKVHYSLYKENDENEEYDEYFIIECLGCESVAFLHSNSFKTIEGEEVTIEERYPKIHSSINEEFFLSDDEKGEITMKISDLYEEVQNAFNNESQILCSLGLRTILETICNDKQISGRNLKDKVNNLQTQGHISIIQMQTLDKLRIIGNLSAHKTKKTSLYKLGHAFHIINHLLREVYILPKVNKRMKI